MVTKVIRPCVSILAVLALSACVRIELAPVEVVPEPLPGQGVGAPVPAERVTQQPVTGETTMSEGSTSSATSPLLQGLPSALNGAATVLVGPVRMEVLPQYDPITTAGATSLNVLVRLSAGGEVKTDRPALDLAIVLDRSGSMSGPKLQDAKQASLDLLKKLEPRDRVTLVTYDDTVVVHRTRLMADAAGQDALRGDLLAVQVGGSTALGPALYKALEVLEPAERGEKDIAHVMLLSDGLANVGEQRPDVLGARAAMGFSRGVSVTTLGVGLDYNEDLMTRLADQGGGRYHFIKDSASIQSVLNDELAGLAATVAREVWLTLSGAKDVKVFGYSSEIVDGGTRARIGALRAGQVAEIMVRLSVEPGADVNSVLVGTFGLKLRDTTRDGSVAEGSVALKVGVSPDAEQVRKQERTEVTVRVAEVESAELLEQAARAVERRDYSGARQLLNSNIVQTRQKAVDTSNKKLEEQAQELEGVLKSVDEAEVNEKAQKNFTKEQKSKSYQMRKK